MKSRANEPGFVLEGEDFHETVSESMSAGVIFSMNSFVTLFFNT